MKQTLLLTLLLTLLSALLLTACKGDVKEGRVLGAAVVLQPVGVVHTLLIDVGPGELLIRVNPQVYADVHVGQCYTFWSAPSGRVFNVAEPLDCKEIGEDG